MSEDILARWLHDPNRPNTGVRHGPLPSGQWENQEWGAQTARCSNNRRLQAPIGRMNAVRWVVESEEDDPDIISFNVSIDRPGNDLLAWLSQGNNSVVAVSPLPDNLTLSAANERGFYIASVQGATAPFTVKAIASHQ
jgi:hypothetical protein